MTFVNAPIVVDLERDERPFQFNRVYRRCTVRSTVYHIKLESGCHLGLQEKGYKISKT